MYRILFNHIILSIQQFQLNVCLFLYKEYGKREFHDKYPWGCLLEIFPPSSACDLNSSISFRLPICFSSQQQARMFEQSVQRPCPLSAMQRILRSFHHLLVIIKLPQFRSASLINYIQRKRRIERFTFPSLSFLYGTALRFPRDVGGDFLLASSPQDLPLALLLVTIPRLPVFLLGNICGRLDSWYSM